MNETPASPSEKTVVVNKDTSCRLRTLVILSLGLNGLILAIFLIGFLCHLHQRHLQFLDRGGRFQAMDQRDFSPRDRHFGGRDFQGMGAMGMRQGGMRDGAGMGMGMDMGRKAPPSPADMTDKILNRLSKRLALTDDQKTKLRPIIEQQAEQLQKDMETRRQLMQKLMEDTKTKIKPVLNPDQQKQLDQVKLPGQPPPPHP